MGGRAWVLASIVFGLAGCSEKAGQQASAPASPPAIDAPADATIREIMAGYVDPAGDFLFESVQEVSSDKGVEKKAPKTDAEWAEVKAKLEILKAAPPLLTAPGRKVARAGQHSSFPEVENEPEVTEKAIAADPAAFRGKADALAAAADLGLSAVAARNVDGLSAALLQIDRACESCHLSYWYPRDERAKQAAREEGLIP